jgi:two-component system response regulator
MSSSPLSPYLLLVEDNASDEALALRALGKQGLEQAVAVARDGEEALQFLLGPDAPKQLPQAVLLDLKLPKIDGLQVLQALRADPRTRMLPVTILTSSSEDADLTRSYELGANSYVRKPVDFEDFARTIGLLGLYWLRINHAVSKPLPDNESPSRR